LRRAAVTVLALALVGGTTAAFVVTEHLKLERSPVTAPRFDRVFSPVCTCPQSVARLTLRLRKRDRVDAVIVDRQGKPVRTLVANEPFRSGDVTFRWDGRTDSGEIVPDARYRLRIHLRRQRRTIQLPNTVLVDTKPPKLTLLEVSRGTISPDGNGVNDRLRIVYRTNEKSGALVLVDGRAVVEGKVRPPGRSALFWRGSIGGAPAEAGVYELSLHVRDVAGNLSLPAGAVIRIRYIELAESMLAVPKAGLLRFRVVTDALPYAWTLAYDTRHGQELSMETEEGRNAIAVRIAKDAIPGDYELRVEAAGHSDTAVVTITGASR